MQTSCGGRDDSLVARAAPPERARLQHQPALDGLRGLAVAGVLFFHGGHLQGGFLGVDAFFVLSGFLITSLLLVEASERGRISLGAFWARRARRLLPALACVLGAVALYTWLLARPDELATIRGDAFATIGYFANWRAIFNSRDYWSLFRAPSPLDHTWSLAIEEQFYLAWPLLVAVLAIGARGRHAARRVLVTSVALALGSLAWMLVIFDPTNPSRAYFGTDTRVASILVGAALAAWLRLRGPTRSGAVRGALELSAIGALVLLTLAWTRLSGSSTTLYRGGLFLCALSAACVIAAAVHPRRGPVNHLFSFRPLRALGLISYGVYLWHWPSTSCSTRRGCTSAAGPSSRCASRRRFASRSSRTASSSNRSGTARGCKRDRPRAPASSASASPSRPRSPLSSPSSPRPRPRRPCTSWSPIRSVGPSRSPPPRRTVPARASTTSGSSGQRVPRRVTRRRQFDGVVRRRRRLQADPHDPTARRLESGLHRMPPPSRGDTQPLSPRRALRRAGARVSRQLGHGGRRLPTRRGGDARQRADRRRARDRRALDRSVRARLRHGVRTRVARPDPPARVGRRARHSRDDGRM